MQTVGFAFCGSFCTFRTVIRTLEEVKTAGYGIQPIMSETAAGIDTALSRETDAKDGSGEENGSKAESSLFILEHSTKIPKTKHRLRRHRHRMYLHRKSKAAQIQQTHGKR